MSGPTKRRWLLFLYVVGGLVVCLGVALLYLLGYIYWRRPAIASLTSRDPQALLATADYLALLGNWQGARPYFAKAEQIFAQHGDRRNELYAEVSCVQADVEKGSYAEAARYLNQQFSDPTVQGDARLKLRFLTVKGVVDLNTNTVDAEHDWAEALAVAKSLGDITWQTRATGWLGILDFVNGNSSQAQRSSPRSRNPCGITISVLRSSS